MKQQLAKRTSRSHRLSPLRTKATKLRQPVAVLKRMPNGYARLLDDVKQRIASAQVRANLSANRELVMLYWEIGREILERQSLEGWGEAIVVRLSKDIRRAFPGVKGFSARNLWDMRRFFEAYRHHPKLRQLVAEIPWGHNLVLLNTVKNVREREWYMRRATEYGWSRNVLLYQVDSQLYHRQGKAITNFKRTLPSPQSDMAQQLMKDPYIFPFLTSSPNIKERDIEKSLIEHLRDFLLELGVGFAYVGNQYPLDVKGDEYSVDLLLYHLHLHRYVAVDLKRGAYEAEHAGKMNMYLSAIDDQLRHRDDQASVGMILCREKNKLVVEYSLRDIRKPIGVASYQRTTSLPKQFKGRLPSVEEIEQELFGKTKSPL